MRLLWIKISEDMRICVKTCWREAGFCDEECCGWRLVVDCWLLMEKRSFFNLGVKLA